MGSLILRLVRLAAPVAVGRMGVVGMGVVDMIVVGQLAPRELAHLGLGWAINGPALYGGIGLLIGVQIFAARAIGAAREAEVGAIWRRGLLIALGAGVMIGAVAMFGTAPLLLQANVAPELAHAGARIAGIFALAVPLHLMFMATTNALEALQRPLPGAATMWLANGINLGANLLLVPAWGAEGSAWATVLSRAFLCAAIVAYVIWTPSLAKSMRASGGGERGIAALLGVGLAAAAASAAEAGAFASLGVISARQGAVAAATFSLATGGVLTLVYLLAQGLATAGAVLTADALGRGDKREAARAGWAAVALCAFAMIVCGVLCFAFAAPLGRAFAADSAIALSLASAMALVALLTIPDGVQGVADAVLRARGLNWSVTLWRMAPFVIVAPPLAYWLAPRAGVAGVLAAVLVASTLACALMLWRLATIDRRADI